jgi:hypothetical protein
MKTLIQKALVGTILLAFAVSAEARSPLSDAQGASWKAACSGASEGRYSCCQNKVRACREGCPKSDGAAATNCRATCSSSFSACTKTKVIAPSQSPAGGKLPKKFN